MLLILLMLKTSFVFILCTGALFIFKEPSFIESRGFKITSLGLKQSVIQTDLYYYNPNKMGLYLKKVDADVFINDKLAGHSMIDTLIKIPAKDTFAIPVRFNVEMKNLLSNAFSILMQDQIDVKMKGFATVGKAGIFIKLPVNYQGKHSF